MSPSLRHVVLILSSGCIVVAWSHMSAGQCIDDNSIPQLSREAGIAQLMVDGKPWLIRGGELGNSSASNRDYMKVFWPQLVEELTPLILEHQGQGTMAGVAPRVSFDEQEIPTQQIVNLGGYELTVNFEATDP